MKSLIDTSRANTLYLGGVGALMVASLLVGNLPQLHLSELVSVPYQSKLMWLFLQFGIAAGVLTVARHLAREREPWKVPRAQVSLCFAAFFVFTLAGILLSR